MRRAFAAIAAVVLAAIWLVAVASPALAADAVTFGTPTATSKFGDGLTFDQPVTMTGGVERVEILLSDPGGIGPTVQPVTPASTTGATTLHYHLDLTNSSVVPNTPFTAQWRVVSTIGQSWLGPKVERTYADDRFDWKTLDGKVVRVHWSQGDQSFGERALKIGDDAVAAASQLLGVTESAPIDFYIYADQPSFYDALGPGTQENVGGQAHPDIRTVFALITPSEIDDSWVSTVVPHELTHVVFQTAVDNPYHDPPHWLNEGLAVYLSAGYQDSDRQQVEDAAKSGTIIPLDGLAGAFPTSQDRFFLAYAESVSAVDRIVRVNGRDALVKLIRSYASGVSDDEAFQAALGRNLAGFEADWLDEVGATPPTRVGPRAAPAGPLPAGWMGPVPNPSFDVTSSLPPQPPSAPRPIGEDNQLSPLLASSTVIIGVAVLVVLAIVLIRRAGRRESSADHPAWNQVYGRRPTDDPPTGPPATGFEARDGGPAPIHFGAADDDAGSASAGDPDPENQPPDPAGAEPRHPPDNPGPPG